MSCNKMKGLAAKKKLHFIAVMKSELIRLMMNIDEGLTKLHYPFMEYGTTARIRAQLLNNQKTSNCPPLAHALWPLVVFYIFLTWLCYLFVA